MLYTFRIADNASSHYLCTIHHDMFGSRLHCIISHLFFLRQAVHPQKEFFHLLPALNSHYTTSETLVSLGSALSD